MSVRTARVAVIGAGAGGLAAAVALAARGLDVVVLERAGTPGGKLREVAVGGARIDAGPTVFTMRWVFEELFAAAGTTLDTHLTLRKLDVLARHAWSETERLDLFADSDASADAIGAFAGPKEAQGFRAFSARARKVYRALEGPFIRAQRPNAVSLVTGAGLRGAIDLTSASPFSTLWRALGENFADPRLRQLFGRYSTYTGASPFQAPAILMLIAHVEQEGVWSVEGGMHRVATSLADLAIRCGATIRYGTQVAEILVAGNRASGVRLASGEQIAVDAVVLNGDVGALGAGLFGSPVARAVPAISPRERSLSAMTWAIMAPTSGFPLVRHNVLFCRDYTAEFESVFRHRRLPADPTVYVCAQDRLDGGGPADGTAERLLCLVNAPAIGDERAFTVAENAVCQERMLRVLKRCGLNVTPSASNSVLTTPADFEALFPATGGALYGQALHGPMTAFRRPGSRTKIPGLYLAGGSVHPGAGVPMAALSGRLAAESVLADLASTQRSRTTAIAGGISTR